MEKLKYFHPLVNIMLIGTIFVRMASFMTMPFLAIYLQNTLNADPIIIGVTLGAAALFGTVGGFIGGYLTDRFGRKIVILTTLVIYTFVFFGFALSKIVILFIVLNAINGFCRATFEPATQALMIDFTEEDKKRRLFSIRYTAINIAAVVGPLIGVALTKFASPIIPFIVTGVMYAIYALFLVNVFKRFDVEKQSMKTDATFGKMVSVLAQDWLLVFILIGGAFISFGYSQINSTLPQILTMTITDAVEIYSMLIALNAIVVLVFQLPVSIISEKWSLFKTLMVGVVMFAGGFIIFALATNMFMYILGMIIFTLGEIFSFPPKSALIERIAPANQKAMYLGASQLSQMGSFIGPIAGGWLIIYLGANSYFIVAFIILLSIYFYYLAARKMENDNTTVVK